MVTTVVSKRPTVEDVFSSSLLSSTMANACGHACSAELAAGCAHLVTLREYPPSRMISALRARQFQGVMDFRECLVVRLLLCLHQRMPGPNPAHSGPPHSHKRGNCFWRAKYRLNCRMHSRTPVVMAIL